MSWSFRLISTAVLAGSFPPQGALGQVDVSYAVHLECNDGDRRGDNCDWLRPLRGFATAGTEGQSRRLEAIRIRLEGMPSSCTIEYRSHVEDERGENEMDSGWQPWVRNGKESGTTGRSKRLEGIQIRLVGCPGWHTEYQAHVECGAGDRRSETCGWLQPVRDGQLGGTERRSRRMEAIRIRLLSPFVEGCGHTSFNRTGPRVDTRRRVALEPHFVVYVPQLHPLSQRRHLQMWRDKISEALGFVNRLFDQQGLNLHLGPPRVDGVANAAREVVQAYMGRTGPTAETLINEFYRVATLQPAAIPILVPERGTGTRGWASPGRGVIIAPAEGVQTESWKLGSLLAHEIGHFFGLADLWGGDDSRNLMFGIDTEGSSWDLPSGFGQLTRDQIRTLWDGINGQTALRSLSCDF